MSRLLIDPDFQSLIPPLTDEERQQLEANILADGCRDPLVAWNGILLDGHNRYAICQSHGLEFKTVEKVFADRDDAKIWIITNQFGRRNLAPFSRSELALHLEPLIAAKARARQSTSTGGVAPQLKQRSAEGESVETRKEVAKAAGVSHDTIAKAKVIAEKATEDVKEKLRKGETTINREYQAIVQPENRARKIDAIVATAVAPVEESDRRYPLIYADPPWRYEHVKTESRSIENQYPTMDLDAICAMRVTDLALDDAILFLWATSPKLAEAMRVVEAWGFTYRTSMVWVKDQIGMGYYARQRHELLLICTRGNLPTPEPANRPDSVVMAPREQHSTKPVKFYDLIERMYPELPKIELFCRSPRDGWSAWGNQAA